MNVNKLVIGMIIFLLVFSIQIASASETFFKDVNGDNFRDTITIERNYKLGKPVVNLQIVDGHTNRDIFIRTNPIGNLPSATENVFFEQGLLLVLCQMPNNNNPYNCIIVYKYDKLLSLFLPCKLVKITISNSKLKTPKFLHKLATKSNGINLCGIKNFYYLLYYAKHEPDKIRSLVNIQTNFSGDPIEKIKRDANIDKEILYIQMDITEPNEYNPKEAQLSGIFIFFIDMNKRGRHIDFDKNGTIIMYESNGEMDKPEGLYQL